MKTNNQRGSSHIVVVLALIVLVGVGAAGYRVMHTSTPSSTSDVSVKSTEPTTLKSSVDVTKASTALDNIGIDGAVNPSELDSDMSTLL